MSDTLYAIGDVHGQLAQLETALMLIEKDGGAEAKTVFVGDLVDRGQDSRRVIELIMDGLAAGRNWTVLKGNHDRMFDWFMQTPLRQDPHLQIGHSWLHPRLGGDKTLASYGIDASEGRRLYEVQREAFDAIPPAQIAFLRALPLTFQHANWFFVHAGIRPNIPLSEQFEDDLLWIREPFLSYQDRHPFMVVHGHTALDAPAHFGNRINLDGGAGYGRPLVPVALNKETMRLLC